MQGGLIRTATCVHFIPQVACSLNKVFYRSCDGETTIKKPRENQITGFSEFFQKILVKLQRVYAQMTWLGEAMKDGVSTDMFRVVANRL